MDRVAYLHFARRAKERFGVVLSEHLVYEIESCIRKGYYHRICRQGDDIALYRVPVGRKMAAVAYNHVTGVALTIMPIEWTGRAYKIERELAAVTKDNENKEHTA
jgi:hypothetical protein